jgi:creatinine amidohydrolase
MKQKSSSYGEMSWAEIKDCVEERRVAVLPVGAVENHGPHLPVDTDAVIAEAICKRVGELIPNTVLVMPTVHYGMSQHHMDFPGTVTVRPHILTEYVIDICNSLVDHGFKTILIVNGHGGNTPSLDVAARRTVTERGVLCTAVSWWDPPKVKQTYQQLKVYDEQGRVDHGGITETSIYLAAKPHAVDMEKAVRVEYPSTIYQGEAPEKVPESLVNADYYLSYWSGVTPYGSVGDPTKASTEKGKILIESAAQAIVDIIKALSQMKPRQRVDHH